MDKLECTFRQPIPDMNIDMDNLDEWSRKMAENSQIYIDQQKKLDDQQNMLNANKQKSDREYTLNNPELWLKKVVRCGDHLSLRCAKGFDSWENSTNPKKGDTVNQMRTLLALPDKLERGFWLYGLEGNGKTHGKVMTMVEIYKKYEKYRYDDFQFKRWVRVWKDYNEAKQKTSILSELYSKPILALDEPLLKVTKPQIDALSFILDECIDRGVIVLVSTNQSPPQLAREERAETVGENNEPGFARVTSRLQQLCKVIQVIGDNRRGKLRKRTEAC